jgi:hypothetical protein
MVSRIVSLILFMRAAATAAVTRFYSLASEGSPMPAP